MLINSIIPFSNVDGPGNNYVVFLQGCNLNCLYCHNYETINLCNNCGECISTCKTNSIYLVDGIMTYNKETCVECDACIQTCPYDSTPKAMTISPTDLASQIISYKDFIDGVTFSGGECMLQANEIKEVVELLKPYNIKVFIDSNATFDIDSNRELIDLVDGFMLDIKAIDKDISKELTGYEYDFINTVIQINKLNKLLELRVVDCNDLESKKVIAWIDCFIKNNPSVNKRINKLATKPLKEDKVIKLNDFIRKHS